MRQAQGRRWRCTPHHTARTHRAQQRRLDPRHRLGDLRQRAQQPPQQHRRVDLARDAQRRVLRGRRRRAARGLLLRDREVGAHLWRAAGMFCARGGSNEMLAPFSAAQQFYGIALPTHTHTPFTRAHTRIHAILSLPVSPPQHLVELRRQALEQRRELEREVRRLEQLLQRVEAQLDRRRVGHGLRIALHFMHAGMGGEGWGRGGGADGIE